MSNSSSARHREELLRLHERLQQIERDLAPLGVKLQEQFKQLAGPILPEMLESRSNTERHLDNPNPKNRCTALCLISDYWGPNEQFVIKCEAMIREDSDPEVRGCAISCIATYYARSNDTRVGRLLVGLVFDDSESVIVREAAYRVLFKIRGLPIESWPGLSSFQFPEDVDWSFANTFL